MKCEIIAVGTELLLGNILNTNAKYLSEKLAELGVDVYYQTVVGDNLERAAETIAKALERSDLVITSGGLGPTDDDLTKEALCKALDLRLVLHEPSLKRIEAFFKTVNRPMAECNKKQAYIPEGSAALQNDNGTAPGILLDKDNKLVALLPGPPFELIPLFEKDIYPLLKARTNSLLKSKTLRIVGIGESSVQEDLKEIFDTQTNPTIAPYAKSGEVHLRVTAKADNNAAADMLIAGMIEKVSAVLQNHIYGFDEDNLETVLVRLLSEKKLTISTAESCTGGLIAERITSVPGASKCYMNSIITYSNQSKMHFLGVQESTLLEHGAVSEEAAIEMAKGIKQVSATDIGLSITGIAGPDGGTAEKPVGLCYIGVAYKDTVKAYKHMFPGTRERIRLNSSTRALDIVRRLLLD